MFSQNNSCCALNLEPSAEEVCASHVSSRPVRRLTDRVGAQRMQHAALGDGLEGGTTQDKVDPFLDEVTEAQFSANFLRQTPELPVIGVRHAGEPDAKPWKGWGVEEGTY